VDIEFHVFLTSALVGGEWSASRPGRFTAGENIIIIIISSSSSSSNSSSSSSSSSSVVGIAADYGLGDREVRIRVSIRLRIFSSPSRSDRRSFSGVKRPGREADHSPPTSVEVKKI
jgi:hypothetical protein